MYFFGVWSPHFQSGRKQKSSFAFFSKRRGLFFRVGRARRHEFSCVFIANSFYSPLSPENAPQKRTQFELSSNSTPTQNELSSNSTRPQIGFLRG